MAEVFSVAGKEDEYDLQERMCTAIQEDDEQQLRDCLEQWKHRNFAQQVVDDCLSIAALADNAALVGLLMEYGAKPDPVMISDAANASISTAVWQQLLDHGWDVNSRDHVGRPLLNIYLVLQKMQMVEWFLSKGASPNTRDGTNGLTPVSFSAGYRSIDTLKLLLAHGGTLTDSNALHQAASNSKDSRIEMMEFLVDENGLDVNQLSNYGPRRVRNGQADGMPLHKAIYSGRRDHIEWLLKRGARPESKDSWGFDAKTFAKEFEYDEAYGWVEEWMQRNGGYKPEATEAHGDE